MNCNEFNNVTAERLGTSLSPEAAKHARSCPACRALFEDLTAITHAAAALPDFEPETDLWSRLETQLRAEGLTESAAGMTCEEFFSHAGETLEGERNPAAFEHLYKCSHCRNLLHELDAVAHAGAQLPDLEPSTRLWRRIRSQARKEDLWQEESWWERWAAVPQPVFSTAAAVVMLLFGVGLVQVQQLSLNALPPIDPEIIARTEMVTGPDYATRYEIHLLNVERDILDQNTKVADNVIDLVEKPLQTVDRVIAETRKALEENPDSPYVREELNRLYRQKASVLQAMTTLTYQEYGE